MDRFEAFTGPKELRRQSFQVGPHTWQLAVVRAAAALDQDRYVLTAHDGGVFVALADGAGGSGHGREAAEAAVAIAPSADALVLSERVVAIDDALAASHGGQSTLLAFFLGPAGLVGAGVGDTELWWRDESAWHDGTANVTRKPLLGTAAATSVEIATPLPTVVVAATDGLWKYAAPFEVLRLVDAHPDEPLRVLDPLWLASGGLPDDVTVVIARRSS